MEERNPGARALLTRRQVSRGDLADVGQEVGKFARLCVCMCVGERTLDARAASNRFLLLFNELSEAAPQRTMPVCMHVV